LQNANGCQFHGVSGSMRFLVLVPCGFWFWFYVLYGTSINITRTRINGTRINGTRIKIELESMELESMELESMELE